MDKKKILAVSIAAIFVLIAGTAVAFFATGGLDSLRNRFADDEETTSAQITEPEETVNQRPKTEKPASTVAVIFGADSQMSTQDIDSLNSLGFNSVIYDINSENAARVSSALQYSISKGIYSGIRTSSDLKSSAVSEFISENNLDFAIISGLDETAEDYVETIKELSSEIKGFDSGISLGIMPEFITKISQSITDLSSSSDIDFVFICEKNNDTSSFKNAQDLYSENSIDVWLCHCLEKLNDYSASQAQSKIDLISASADISQCSALAFYPFDDIKNTDSQNGILVKSYIVKREKYLEDKEFSITNYDKTSITVDVPSITFRGTSSPLYEVTCNGNKIVTADNGDFSVDCKLNIGDNKIVFIHRNKTYNYNVNYKIKVLKSVSPSKSVTVPGGIEVEVTALAIKGSTVKVSFNGSTYTMTADSGFYGDDDSYTSSDFVTYYANLKTPAGKSSAQKLGNFKVTATYKGITESKTGAGITVSAVEPVTVAPPEPESTTTQKETTASQTETSSDTTSSKSGITHHPSVTSLTSSGTEASDSSQSSSVSEKESTSAAPTTASTSATTEKTDLPKQYDYNTNYGLGKARMAVITENYVETYSGSNTSSKSVPDCSPLLKGTVDYILDTGTCSDDDDNVKYYYLKSGVKVPLFREENTTAGKDTRITHLREVEGYIMPKNNISVLSCSNSGNKTIIKLSMNRLVAFNAKLTGQSYSSYNGRPVAVSSVDATGLEFTFSDTDKFAGTLSFMNSNIKSASSSVSNNAATLKFVFQNPGKFYGFHYEYSNGILTIVIKQKPSSISGYTVMIDAGHGGYDGGASCTVSSSTWSEKKINLAIAQKVKEYLEKEGANVIMTRTSDSFLSLTSRNEMVRNHQPDLFISIHCDSSSSASAYGTSAFYYRAYSQPLAKYIHQAIVNAYNSNIYSGQGRDKVDRGTSFYAYRVARVEECPAVLIEYGFVSNTTECQELQDSSVRDTLARATVTGIKNYIANS